MSSAFLGTDEAFPARDPAVPPDDGALRLVLVRHGRTPSNVIRALDTALPGPPLDELGRAQAAAVAELFVDWPVRAVFASRATRAQQTAASIADRLGLPVTTLDGVHEIFVGELDGLADDASRALFGEIFASWWDGDPDRPQPGGESATDLRARFLADVERALHGIDSGTVVVVSHGAAIRLSCAALLQGREEAGRGRLSPLPNTGRVVLRRDPEGWSLELWDLIPEIPDY
ncbi:MAG: histidine phosphatase family protein [Pseudonocardia sp.]|nr:histidine phosphatase family protein [Pseudonocardia sp.]